MSEKTGGSWICLDMDGTLWDAVDEIVVSWNQVFEKEPGISTHIGRSDMLGLMGKTMDHFARTLIPSLPLDQSMEIMHRCEKVENSYLARHGAEIYDGVPEMLADLRQEGYHIGIVSNCQSGYIEAFLQYYHLENLVDDKLCYGDTGHGKAENLEAFQKKHRPEAIWYLGDTQGDYDACRQAGVPFIWASYGFGTVDAPVPSIDAPDELLECLKKLQKPDMK